MSNPVTPDKLEPQKPNKIEVGYWANRSKDFNTKLERGLNGQSPAPAPKKKVSKEQGDAKNTGSEPKS